MKRCDNCGVKLNKDGLRTHEGVFCSKDCADGIVLPHNCIEHQPVPECEVKFIAEKPVPIYPIPESITGRIKKHCTRCAAIIGAECWKGVSGVFCSKECAMCQEIPPIAALIKEQTFSNKDAVEHGMHIAYLAMEERKKYINDL